MGRLGRDRPEKKEWHKTISVEDDDKGGVGKIKEIKERGGEGV